MVVQSKAPAPEGVTPEQRRSCWVRELPLRTRAEYGKISEEEADTLVLLFSQTIYAECVTKTPAAKTAAQPPKEQEGEGRRWGPSRWNPKQSSRGSSSDGSSARLAHAAIR